jgi:hypothetical protein
MRIKTESSSLKEEVSFLTSNGVNSKADLKDHSLKTIQRLTTLSDPSSPQPLPWWLNFNSKP